MSYVWGFIAFSCLAWYTVMCVYITFYGAFDIKSMLAHLHNGDKNSDTQG